MSKDPQKKSTEKLGDDPQGLSFVEPEVTYRPIPHQDDTGRTKELPVWLVRFDLVSDPSQRFGLEINGEVIFGRDTVAPELVDLGPYEAAEQGVSRRHLMLRPTTTNLYVIDLGSTNGTLRNGRSIGFNTPYSLVNGDILTLGWLQFLVRIIERPLLKTSWSQRKLDLADALTQIAKAITSQLNLEDVLNQITETAMSLTSAGETGIWLVDENTGELFLEAERGIEDEKIRLMRLPIDDETLAGKVVKSGKPQRASRQPGEDQIKVKTDYFVEALVYVPITLGGITFGVLAAAHRQAGKEFDSRDERLLSAIADFAAIAIQNARLYQATDKELERRIKELSALNEVSRAVSASLDLDRVYQVLVEQVNKHWPVESVHLHLVDERQRVLHRLLPSQATTNPERDQVNKGIMEKVAKSGEVFVTNEIRPHANGNHDSDQTLQSIACVPLSIQEQVVGVLTLLNKADGPFTDEDISRLEAFANPVATAIENARLFEESERQRAAIQATAETLSQPLLILDEQGNVLIANQAANVIRETDMAQLFEGSSNGVGGTTEVCIDEQTFLSTIEHLPEVGTIIIMQDITYVKELERNRAEFMHALSHDLKSPLTSIVGWAQLLEKVIPLNEKSIRYVNQILAAADRMLGMINEILRTVSRGEAIEIEREPCQLTQIVSKGLNDVEGAALNKSIQISFVQEGQPYAILADGTRLYHMVLNLVDNAIKYSPKNTRVDVRLHFNDDGITLQLQDEGPGIAEDELPYVFDKYYRGTEANTQPGAGLGLSVVQSIAEAHRGQVSVRNLPRCGTEFTVTLPGSLRHSDDDTS